MPIRSQLSLFVPPSVAAEIEAIRRIVDPVQHRLIPAHVTLCREDELAGFRLAECEARLGQAPPGPLTLQFGPPERFGEHGILLPCVGGADGFQSLREIVLGSRQARAHAPHLTLAHPRNPRAPRNSLDSAAALRAGLQVTFEAVHLIEQRDDDPWIVRATIPLVASPPDPS